MGCACGAKTVARQSFIVTFTDGSNRTYPSEAEAQAAIARKGGGTYKIKS